MLFKGFMPTDALSKVVVLTGNQVASGGSYH